MENPLEITFRNTYQISDIEISVLEAFIFLRHQPSTPWANYVVVTNKIAEISQDEKDKKDYNLDTGWIRIYHWLKTHAN